MRSHSRESTAAFLVVKAGCNSFPLLAFHLDRHSHRAITCTCKSCTLKKAQSIFCWLCSSGLCVLTFSIAQTRTLTGLNNSTTSKQIQSISASRISVSYNAPLTSHTSKTDPRRDISYKNAPYKLKKPLFKKWVGLHRRALQQQIYLCLAAPGAASKEKGDYKASTHSVETLPYFHWTRLAQMITQNRSELRCI